MGEHSLLGTDYSEKIIKICKFKIHPLYQHHYESIDLAILEFCDHVEFNKNIQPIELAPPKLNIWKYGRPNVTTAGWGRMENNEKSYELRAVTQQLRTLPCEVCEYVSCSLYTRL